MPKFCANLTWLFAELDFMDRFAAAREAGFDAVEVLSPYDVPVQDVVIRLGKHDLKMALMSCPPPNYTGGAPGYAAVAGSEGRFEQDFKRTIRVARALGAQNVQILAGQAQGDAARDVMIRNLRWAVAEAPKQMLTIEPVNRDENPGAFLHDAFQALDLIEAVAAPNLRLQFDACEMARIHGDILKLWPACRDATAHVQVAQMPHRTEPDDGKIPYPAFFDLLDKDGFGGWVSGEYAPARTTLGGLGWMR